MTSKFKKACLERGGLFCGGIKMADRKKHHYVPESYLKRFSIDGVNVYIKIQNEIKFIPLSDQNQKNYLYSLGKEFFKDKHNLFEDFLGDNVEVPFNMDMGKTIDKGVAPRNDNLVSIVYFAIVQSCRPLIYRNEFEESFKSIGLSKENNFLLSYGFLVVSLINNFWEKIRTCSVEVLKACPGKHFVTSDNPSTLWVPINQKMEFLPITLRFLHVNNPELELIMPLNPNWLIKVYLNRTRPVSQTEWSSNEREISSTELSEINERINLAKQKILYSLSDQELLLILSNR